MERSGVSRPDRQTVYQLLFCACFLIILGAKWHRQKKKKIIQEILVSNSERGAGTQVLHWRKDARAIHGHQSISHWQKSCEALAWYKVPNSAMRGCSQHKGLFLRGCFSAGTCLLWSSQESSPGCSLVDLGRPCSEYPDVTWVFQGRIRKNIMSPEPASQFAKQPRPQTFFWSLPAWTGSKKGQVHSHEIDFELCILLRFGREAEVLRVSLGIRAKKKILYFHCVNLIFLLIAETSSMVPC